MIKLDTHSKHIAYTMTLAGAGFAYVDAFFAGGDTFFGQEVISEISGTSIISGIGGIAIAAFLLSLILGVTCIFSMTGLEKLEAHADDLSAQLDLARVERIAAGSMTPGPEEVDLAKRISQTKTKIDTYFSGLKFRSNIHLTLLCGGFIAALVLFLDAKFDPDAPPRSCPVSVNADGTLSIPISCSK